MSNTKITLANGKEIELSQESYDKLVDGVKQGRRWVPEKAECYWCLDNDGYSWSVNLGYPGDDWRIKTGNIFKYKEQAIAHKEWLEAKAVIQEDAGWWEPDWSDDNQYKYSGWYSNLRKEISYSFGYTTKYPEAIYFKSEKAIEESQEKHRAEWLVYLKVKED